MELEGNVIYEKQDIYILRSNDFVLTGVGPTTLVFSVHPVDTSWNRIVFMLYDQTVFHTEDAEYLYFCGPAQSKQEAVSILRDAGITYIDESS